MQTIIKQFYPNAISSDDFIQETYKVLATAYNLPPNQILLAHSICSDDVNSIEYPEEGRKMLGPFNLGGLNGFPFTGLTGMGAFAHHIPENGAALIFYAPHIGIGTNGIPGQILRLGQPTPSSCCGALVKALQSLREGSVKEGHPDLLDYQQQTLEQIVLKSEDRINGSSNKIIEATEVIYEASGQAIDRLIAHTSFTGKYLFVIGAIIINSDHEFGSFQELRRFDCLDAQTKEIIASHTFIS